MKRLSIIEFLALRGSETNLRNIGIKSRCQLENLRTGLTPVAKLWEQKNPEKALQNRQIHRQRFYIKKTLIKLSLCLI